MFLLDGVAPERARTLVAVAAGVYQHAGIALVPTFRTVNLPIGDQQQLLGDAKALLGGARPTGTDVVHVITSKTLERTGVADCIGGIAYPTRAFSISMDFPDVPAWCYVGAAHLCYGHLDEFAGKVVAHEIGHLLGAQHQLSSYECTTEVDTANGACTTVMDGQPLVPYGDVFSRANATLVRSHLARFGGR
jgi:hypothetical protein